MSIRKGAYCFIGSIVFTFCFCGRDSFLPMKNEAIPRQTVTMGEPSESWKEHELAAGQKHIYTWRYEAGPYEKIEIKPGAVLYVRLFIFPDSGDDKITVLRDMDNRSPLSGYFSIGSDTAGIMILEITGYSEVLESSYLIRNYHENLQINTAGGEYRYTTLLSVNPVCYRSLIFDTTVTDTFSFLYPDSRYTYRIILQPFELFDITDIDRNFSVFLTTSRDSVVDNTPYWNEYGDTIELTVSPRRNTTALRTGIWTEEYPDMNLSLEKEQMPVVSLDMFYGDTGEFLLDMDTLYNLSLVKEDTDNYSCVVVPGNIYCLKIEIDGSRYIYANLCFDGQCKFSEFSADSIQFVFMPGYSDSIRIQVEKNGYEYPVEYSLRVSDYTGPYYPDNYEPDNTFFQAVLLAPDSIQTHSIFPAQEFDIFKFSLEAQDTFSISINSDDSAALAWMTMEFSGTIDFPISSDITFIDSLRTSEFFRLTGVKRFTDTLYMELTAPDYLPYTVLLRKY